MKYAVSVLLCWFAFSPFSPAAADSVPAAEVWGRIDAVQKSPEPEREKVDDKPVLTKEYLQAQQQRGIELGDLLLEFVEKYPADSRHWEAVVELTKLRRPVYKSIGDVRNEGWKAVEYDREAQKAWSAKVERHVERMIAAEGVPDEMLEGAYDYWVDAARSALSGDQAADPAEFRRRIDAMKARFPQARMLSVYEWQYLNRLRNFAPETTVAHLTALTNDPNQKIADWAKGELNTEQLRTTPIGYKFTALDGRDVDLGAMRGKVILLDFWATWCGPCKAEMPNVLANYEKYHDQGFEVVAVSLDDEKDRQKLLDYVAENKLPWPQHFDGKGWKNELAARHAIMGIPAMFLFDKNGRLVSTNARGEKLGPEVERLLAQ